MKVKILAYVFVVILTLPILNGFIGYSVGVEDGYIKSVESFIKYYLDLAEKEGIEIPDIYMENMNNALSYLERAKNESNPYKAYKYVVLATIEFSPVYIYIQSNVDDEYLFEKSIYIDSIDVRREIIVKMNKTLDRFEDTMVICIELDVESNGPIFYRDFCVELDMNVLRGILSEAMAKLDYIENNIDKISIQEVEELLNEVDNILANVTIEINSRIGRGWRGMGMVQGVSIATVKILESILNTINRSITQIERGNYDGAIEMLVGLENRLDAYITILYRTAMYAERFNFSNSLIQEFRRLADTMSNVKDLISLAIYSLESGDRTSALNYLEQALYIIQELLSNYMSPIPIHKGFAEMFMNITDMLRDKIRMNMRKFIEGGMKNIEVILDNIERQIEILVTQYEAGRLPRQVFISMLNDIRNTLLDLKDELESMGGSSQIYLERVNQLLSLIEQLLSK